MITAWTQGGEGGSDEILVQLVLWEALQTKDSWHVWGVPAVYGPHYQFPAHGAYAFRPHCPGSRFLCRGSVRSRPWVLCTSRFSWLRFRFLGIPQRHRVGWGCVESFQELRANSGNQGLAAHCPRWSVCPIMQRPGPSCLVSWVRQESTVSGVPYSSLWEDLWLHLPGRCQPSGNPVKTWLGN